MSGKDGNRAKPRSGNIASLAAGLIGRAGSIASKALFGRKAGATYKIPDILPRHVAIIMDGNGRWAKARNLPRTAGHSAGAEALRDIIQTCDDLGIEALSIYAFSTENWSRPEDEVGALMSLMLRLFQSEIDELHRKGARIRILGDIDGLPAPQRAVVVNAMERTKGNNGLKLNVALNYGGRQELLCAAKRMARRALDENMDGVTIDAMTEDDLAAGLYTAGLPDVDLLIRTSGEMRTSNFLPWQSTYAELIFNRRYWPDYTREVFLEDLNEYAGRSRRFGSV